MKRISKIVLAVAVALLAGSCAKTSTHEAEARQRAVKAAKALVATNHADTLALQRSILDAKAVQSEYSLMGDSVAVQAFDESFIDYLRANDAELAAAIFGN